MTPYEAVLLRFVPDQTAGEFINFGVVLWVSDTWSLLFEVNARSRRAVKFFPYISAGWYQSTAESIRRRLKTFASLRLGSHQPELDASRDQFDKILDEVIPVDSTAFQRSEVMSGLTHDPEARLQELYDEYVLRNEQPPEKRARVREHDIERELSRQLNDAGLTSAITKGVEVHGAHLSHRFPVGWQNGRWNVIELISFDLADPTYVREKAAAWTGKLFHLLKGADIDFALTAVVAEPREYDLMPAYRDATAMLRDTQGVADVHSFQNLHPLLTRIKDDIAEHESDA